MIVKVFGFSRSQHFIHRKKKRKNAIYLQLNYQAVYLLVDLEEHLVLVTVIRQVQYLMMLSFDLTSIKKEQLQKRNETGFFVRLFGCFYWFKHLF